MGSQNPPLWDFSYLESFLHCWDSLTVQPNFTYSADGISPTQRRQHRNQPTIFLSISLRVVKLSCFQEGDDSQEDLIKVEKKKNLKEADQPKVWQLTWLSTAHKELSIAENKEEQHAQFVDMPVDILASQQVLGLVDCPRLSIRFMFHF